MDTNLSCLSCQEHMSKPGKLRGGLCDACRHRKDANEFKLATTGFRDHRRPKVPLEATNAIPGTEAKIEVMRTRFLRGENIFDPRDLNMQKLMNDSHDPRMQFMQPPEEFDDDCDELGKVYNTSFFSKESS